MRSVESASRNLNLIGASPSLVQEPLIPPAPYAKENPIARLQRGRQQGPRLSAHGWSRCQLSDVVHHAVVAALKTWMILVAGNEQKGVALRENVRGSTPGGLPCRRFCRIIDVVREG